MWPKNFSSPKTVVLGGTPDYEAKVLFSFPFLRHDLQFNSVKTVNTLQQTALLAFNSLENNLTDLGGSARNNQIAVYVVQEGDVLSFIASDFGVSIETIIWANNLRNINSLQPGQELKIPPISGVIHRVRKNDTLSAIAQKYAGEVEKIIEFNVLPKDGSLQEGAEIIIPEGRIKSVNSGYASSAISRFSYLPVLDHFFIMPTVGRNWGKVHGRNGVDIANSCGTPIFAAAEGLASIADAMGWNGGFGQFIKLIHQNGTETIYAHASKLLIKQGETVTQGQPIALMGTTGRSTGCHLHFEVHGARNPFIKY